MVAVILINRFRSSSDFTTNNIVSHNIADENGLVHNGVIPTSPDKLLQGDIGYHIRDGKHYFSRTDWHRLMEFVNLHR